MLMELSMVEQRYLAAREVLDTVQVTVDELLIRTHQSCHDKSNAFAQPNGKPRRRDVASVSEP